MKGTLDVVSFSTCVRQPDKHGTKEQASKDRRRDRTAALAGIDVFRFTGSDIWRDPWGCATQIVKWAEQGV